MTFRVRTKSLVPVFVLVTVLGLTGSACSEGPGTEEDLISSLTRDDVFSEGEAGCIADIVFDEWGNDDDALAQISSAASYEDLIGPDGIDGFGDIFATAVKTCANLG